MATIGVFLVTPRKLLIHLFWILLMLALLLPVPAVKLGNYLYTLYVHNACES